MQQTEYVKYVYIPPNIAKRFTLLLLLCNHISNKHTMDSNFVFFVHMEQYRESAMYAISAKVEQSVYGTVLLRTLQTDNIKFNLILYIYCVT